MWLYQFEEAPSEETLFQAFNLWADYATESYPIVFVVDRTVVLVLGAGSDTAQKVYTSLWALRPPHEIGSPLVGPGDLHQCQAVDIVLAQTRGIRRPWPQCDGTVTANTILLQFGDFQKSLEIDETRFRRLPVRGTTVWAVIDRPMENGETAERWDVALVDWHSGLVIGVDRDVKLAKFNNLRQLPLPAAPVLEVQDGQLSTHSEVATVLSWANPEPSRWPGTEVSEPVSAFVIERALIGDPGAPAAQAAWRTIAVVRTDGWLVSAGRPRPIGWITVSEGRVEYRDWEVVTGTRYAYRVYGCTPYGRRTESSNVDDAVAGSPFLSNPDYSGVRSPSATTLHGCPGPD